MEPWESLDFYLCCNTGGCRVVEFYTGNEGKEKQCPSCNEFGDLEAY